MAAKNNVTRLLESRKIPHKVYELPEEKIGAENTAHLLGVSPEIVYKTIVITQPKPGKPVLAIIPGPNTVDLKALAQALNVKKVTLPTQKEAENITGLKAGGISPLALINRGFQMVLDSAAENLSEIHISGGQLGLNIRLPVRDLVKITNARLAKISETP